MKKLLVVFGLLLGFSVISYAGTPQENGGTSSIQVGPYSGTTILASSATTSSANNITLTISTPTVFNSGGTAFNGRNCFTKFVVQMSTSANLTIADNQTTKWTLYGIGLGTAGINTLSLPEDHLGPWCTAAGDQTVFTLNAVGTLNAGAESINVEGYTTYGGTNNSGPMY